ncbi:unnamed protein product [Oikopleura dioica]|uniref:J domain-containing protein n=1 Tax=Oikopleura dioica TaxID=34765 RepID=E4XIK7_OIKDI|nr:unnamed protein product [Oikopleura dioica]
MGALTDEELLEKDLFGIVGVDRKATDEQITKAYRKKARKIHPDRNDAPTAHEDFALLNAAKDALLHSMFRLRYEMHLAARERPEQESDTNSSASSEGFLPPDPFISGNFNQTKEDSVPPRQTNGVPPRAARSQTLPQGFGGSAPPRPPPPSGATPPHKNSHQYPHPQQDPTPNYQEPSQNMTKDRILQQEVDRLNKKVSDMEASMMLLRDLNSNLTTYNEKVVTRNAELEKQADELSKQLLWLVTSSTSTREAAPIPPSERSRSSSGQKQKAPRPQAPVCMMALWDYKSDQNGDLQFKEGDVISDVKPTSLGSDWLQGKCNGRHGVFPANFVTEMVASL